MSPLISMDVPFDLLKAETAEKVLSRSWGTDFLIPGAELKDQIPGAELKGMLQSI
jgi:hypothetical protein